MIIDDSKTVIVNQLNNEKRKNKQLQKRLDNAEDTANRQAAAARNQAKQDAASRYADIDKCANDLKENTKKSIEDFYGDLSTEINSKEEEAKKQAFVFLKKTYNCNIQLNYYVHDLATQNSVNTNPGDIWYNGFDEQKMSSAVSAGYTEKCWQYIMRDVDYIVRTNQGMRIGQLYYKTPVLKRVIKFGLQGAFAPIKFTITYPYIRKEADGIDIEDSEENEDTETGEHRGIIKNFIKKVKGAKTANEEVKKGSVKDNERPEFFLSEETKNGIAELINDHYFQIWTDCLEQAEVFGGAFIAITDDNEIITGNRWEIGINAVECAFLFKRIIGGDKSDFEIDRNKDLFFETGRDGKLKDRTINIKGQTIKYKNLFLLKSQYTVNPYFIGMLGGWGASYFEDKIDYCWSIRALEKSNVEQLQNQSKMVFKRNQLFVNRALQTNQQLRTEKIGYTNAANSGVMDYLVIDGNDNVDMLHADVDSDKTADEIWREAGIGGVPVGVLSGKQESGALIATTDDNIIDSLNLLLDSIRTCYFNQVFNCLKLFLINEYEKRGITDKQFVGVLQYTNKGIDSVSRAKKMENIEKLVSVCQTLKNSMTDSQLGEIADIEKEIIKQLKEMISG